MKRFFRYALYAVGVLFCLVIVGLGAGALLLSSQARNQSLQTETNQRSIELPANALRGTLNLELDHVEVIIEAAALGEPLQLMTEYDPNRFELVEHFEAVGDDSWSYELSFDEVGIRHLSQVREFFGAKKPRIRLRVPPEPEIDIIGTFGQSVVTMDYAGLRIDLNRIRFFSGQLTIKATDFVAQPAGPLDITIFNATLITETLGNASPERIDLYQSVGKMELDLRGAWRRDAIINIEQEIGNGHIVLPSNVRLEGVGNLGVSDLKESQLPLLRFTTESLAGAIRFSMSPDDRNDSPN